MLFFIKKRKDEEKGDPFEKDPEGKAKRIRKKKELPKPWGKKERILLLLILILTVGASGILSLQARSWKLPGLPRIRIPKFSIPFFGEETIIVEGNREDEQKAKKVISIFGQKTKSLSGVYGLYVVRLTNGSTYGVNENETFQAASLIKLPVMLTMYIEAEKGNIDLNSKYKLKESDKRPGAGSLYSKQAGYTLTYKDLAYLMGKQSDNTAFTIAKNLLGDKKIEQTMQEIGMTSTDLVSNETTPYDIGLFFEKLWKGNVVSERSRDEILEFMTDTIHEEHLAAGIPDSVRVAHKYGREVHVVNDAGIVFSGKSSGSETTIGQGPFVIVVMSKGVVEKEADKIFPELAKGIYEVENK